MKSYLTMAWTFVKRLVGYARLPEIARVEVFLKLQPGTDWYPAAEHVLDVLEYAFPEVKFKVSVGVDKEPPAAE
jgi:hypothetical protein